MPVELLNSWRDSPDVPDGWTPSPPPGAVVKVPVKNSAVLRLLRDELRGAWYKVYRKGRDGTEVHYFEHASGKVAFVKHKIKWADEGMKTAVTNLVDAVAGSSGSKRELERRLVAMGTGLLSSLRSGEISFDRARADLFNMDNLLALRRHKVGRPVKEFFEWAMELEDVAELAPEGLEESYARLGQIAKEVMSHPSRGRRKPVG